MQITARRGQGLRELVVLLVVVGTLSFSIVYANFQTYDPVLTAATGYSDTVNFIGLYSGEPISSGHQVYRVLVPYLARLIPDIPTALFTPGRSLDRMSVAALKFAIVNLFFLVATSVALYYLIRGFGLSYAQGIVGSLLFLSLTGVVRAGGLPLADTAYFFFLLLAIVAVQRQNLWLLVAATAIGVFAKDLVLLAIPFVLLAPFGVSRRLRLFSGVVPALVIHLALRLWLARSENDIYSSGEFLRLTGAAVRYLFTLNAMARLFMAFGLLWIPCAYAILRRQLPSVLARWSWFIPILFVSMVVLGATNISRHMIAAFPVVIPLALVGLAEWFPHGMDQSAFDPCPRQSE